MVLVFKFIQEEILIKDTGLMVNPTGLVDTFMKMEKLMKDSGLIQWLKVKENSIFKKVF